MEGVEIFGFQPLDGPVADAGADDLEEVDAMGRAVMAEVGDEVADGISRFIDAGLVDKRIERSFGPSSPVEIGDAAHDWTSSQETHTHAFT